jgi:hypothetical protein
MRTDLSYSPSDVFVTLPLPPFTQRLRDGGEQIHQDRLRFMRERELGLTKTYNLVHDPAVAEPAIDKLRAQHREIDAAVLEAYGWSDLALGHGHHETRQGTRYTISAAAQMEVLDRLLELNHARAAAEPAKQPRRTKRARPGTGEVLVDLFTEGHR